MMKSNKNHVNVKLNKMDKVKHTNLILNIFLTLYIY